MSKAIFVASAASRSEADEIIAFAKRFDSQHFYIGPEVAKQTSFGDLIASHWHTAG
jgi:acyl dehydratase